MLKPLIDELNLSEVSVFERESPDFFIEDLQGKSIGIEETQCQPITYNPLKYYQQTEPLVDYAFDRYREYMRKNNLLYYVFVGFIYEKLYGQKLNMNKQEFADAIIRELELYRIDSHPVDYNFVAYASFSPTTFADISYALPSVWGEIFNEKSIKDAIAKKNAIAHNLVGQYDETWLTSIAVEIKRR